MTATNQSRPPGGTGEQARQEASRVGQAATQTGGRVAHAASEQGGHVAAEAWQQTRNLTGQATTQLRDQARTQQHRAADGLRDLGRELGSMAERSGESGLAGEAVRRAADAAQRAAGWLDQREPGEVLDEVRGYARQHPGTFLAGAVVAGLLVGRLTRNMTAADGAGPGAQPAQPAPTAPASSERTVEAPYAGEQPYTGVARAQNVSPPGRPEPEVPGGVAP
ncbi:hypothetical protein [Micromonospora chersina]|uniref:Membrane-anchored ribosome-binding protein, inhibits growth in stationary phase, ElaB/YqjD/DUF883 family n=1 Tax=Micromonospora chersina TaxID=47854 RepID=A0A1C6W0W7_9ACTN|nr:hypothetical protein [Micromonospora chersina]SCL45859.1 hypothetical protein GA0070603_0023 [Micromonospora chersina]SCL72188.1 hypothetical protein GA0070603_6234 [Micromonospora chersina]